MNIEIPIPQRKCTCGCTEFEIAITGYGVPIRCVVDSTGTALVVLWACASCRKHYSCARSIREQEET